MSADGPRRVGSAATGHGIVHLGAGAFARGHPWWCTALAVDAEPGPWGVVAVAQRSTVVVDALRSSRWSYDVDLRDTDESSVFHVDVVRDGLVAAREPDRLLELLADAATLVVTVTATEAGYPADPGTGRLDRSDEGIAAELAGGPPRTVVGQLVATADLRVRRSLPPLSVVVCDNVQDGGNLLRRLTTELAEHLALDDAAHALREEWAFPGSVVDRVVPVVPDDRQPDVVAEPFFRWVLEDAFAGPRPAWERGGAQVVADPRPWQAAKLCLVNAPHSLVAYLGLAQGAGTVDEAIADPFVRAAVVEALASELVPCVPAAPGLDPGTDAQSSVRRFANPAMHHPLRQVGAGGSDKLRERLRAPVDRCRAGAGPARWTGLTVAAWARAVAAGQVDDPRAHDVRSALTAKDSAAQLLEVAGLGGPADDPVAAEVAGWLTNIETSGLVRALTV